MGNGAVQASVGVVAEVKKLLYQNRANLVQLVSPQIGMVLNTLGEFMIIGPMDQSRSLL